MTASSFVSDLMINYRNLYVLSIIFLPLAELVNKPARLFC